MALEEVHCETARQLLEELAQRTVSPLTGARRWIYRGQGDATWPLRPSAFRPETRFPYGLQTVAKYAEVLTPFVKVFRARVPSLPESVTFEIAQTSLEANALNRFFVGVDDAGLPLPEDSQVLRDRLNAFEGLQGTTKDLRWLEEWPPLEVRSILALAQHHGLPTRLLDWSHDYRIAAFFAAKSVGATEALAVWALDWEMLRVRSNLDRVGERSGFAPDKPPPPYRLRLVTAPAASNPNLRAQRGLFTLLEARVGQHEPLPSRIDRLAEARRPLNEIAEGEDDSGLSLPAMTVRKLVLPTSEATQLLKLLALEDVTAAKVRPSYDGVVESVWDTAQGRG